jgi:hypothetical protein
MDDKDRTSGEFDWVNKSRFSEWLFKKKYAYLQKSFPQIIFIYEEEDDLLTAYCDVVYEGMNAVTLERLAKKYFPKFVSTHAKLYEPNQGQKRRNIVDTMIGPEHLEDGEVALAPYSATGYWAIMTAFHKFGEQPIEKVYNFLKEFEKNGKKLGDETEPIFWNSVEGRKEAEKYGR